MNLIFKILFIALILILLFVSSSQTLAATIKTDDNLYISEDEKSLRDLYLFGNSITIDAPVENDLTAAGSTLTLNGNISGSLFAAGGDIFIRSNTKNSLRAAGGNIVLSGKVDNDALLAGGTIRLTNTASVSGDLLILGGDVQINSPVLGKVYINAGNVTLNSKVEGNFEGNLGSLKLGRNAQILGDLNYRANEKAIIENGAIIKGKNNFNKIEEKKSDSRKILGLIDANSFYKLATDIIISILLLTFLPALIKKILENMYNSPLGSAGTGFLFIFFWPFVSILLLILLLLGFISFLIYGLIIAAGLFIGKIFFGWFILNWWEKRQKKEYMLDWKAAIVGPVALFVVYLIPIAGWIVASIIYLIAVGGTIKYLMEITKQQRDNLTTTGANIGIK